MTDPPFVEEVAAAFHERCGGRWFEPSKCLECKAKAQLAITAWLEAAEREGFCICKGVKCHE